MAHVKICIYVTLTVGTRITEWIVYSLTKLYLANDKICCYLHAMKQLNPI